VITKSERGTVIAERGVGPGDNAVGVSVGTGIVPINSQEGEIDE
jgi:hypothetical protein